MIDSRLYYPGDEFMVFLATIAFFTALISTITLMVTIPLQRQPATRHCVLLTGLVCIVVVPILAISVNTSQQSLLDVILPFPVEASSNLSVNDQSVSTTPFAKLFVGPSVHVPAISNNPDAIDSLATEVVERSRPLENGLKSIAGRHEAASLVKRPVWFCAMTSILGAIWITGVVIHILRYLLASNNLAAILRQARPLCDDAYPTARGETMFAMNIEQLPRTVVSSDIQTPVIIGAFQPQIVLPDSLLHDLSEAQIHDILMHETAHAVRRDLWVVQLEALVRIMFWPIPMLPVLIHELDRAREELCDIHVLRTRQRRDYGQTLLRIARLTNHAQPLALATGILPKPGRLESRVSRLLNFDRDESTKTTWLVAVGVWLGFLLVTSLVCGTRLMVNEVHNAETMSVNHSLPTGLTFAIAMSTLSRHGQEDVTAAEACKIELG